MEKRNLLVNVDGINFYAHNLSALDKDVAVKEILSVAGKDEKNAADKKWAEEAHAKIMTEWNKPPVDPKAGLTNQPAAAKATQGSTPGTDVTSK